MSDEEDTDSDGALSNATLIELVYKQGLNAAQWREIGTRLKVKSSTLDEIEWAHHRSPKECLLKVLDAWLKWYGDAATLEKFKRALK